MAAPVPAVPGKSSWGELIGKDVNDAIDTIRQERPNITEVCELNIAWSQLPPPLQEGVVRLVIYYEIIPETRTMYTSKMWTFVTRLRILARLHSKGYLYTF
jgi:hypothetical protein